MAELKVHEAATLFPDIEGEAWDSFVAHVREHGVQKPVVMNDGLLIDGRNRMRAVEQLNAAGETLRGKPYECPAVELKGGDAAVLEFVMQENFERRNMTPFQRAAVAVKADALATKYARAAARDKGEKPPPKPPEGRAEFLAARAGVSKRTVQSALELEKRDPKLLAKAASGELRSFRQAIPPPRGRDGSASNGNGAAADRAEKPEPVVDALGGVVPMDSAYVPVFQARADFVELKRFVKQVAAQAEGIASGPGGAWFDGGAARAELKALRKLVRDAEPYCVCEGCGGSKKQDGKKCKVCAGRGYLGRAAYRAARHEPVEESAVA